MGLGVQGGGFGVEGLELGVWGYLPAGRAGRGGGTPPSWTILTTCLPDVAYTCGILCTPYLPCVPDTLLMSWFEQEECEYLPAG